MPGTARMRGLADPFEPREAIAKSAELLCDLNREFGNLGLAAAAYNAGPGRVRDWLGGRRVLPGETQAYVRIVTGHSAEEWAGRLKTLAEMPIVKAVPSRPRFSAPGLTSRGGESRSRQAVGRRGGGWPDPGQGDRSLS
jgi:hypothetical protein